MGTLNLELHLWLNCRFSFQTTAIGMNLPRRVSARPFDHAAVVLTFKQADSFLGGADGFQRSAVYSSEFPGFVPAVIDPTGRNNFTIPSLKASIPTANYQVIRKTRQLDMPLWATLQRTLRGYNTGGPFPHPFRLAGLNSIFLALAVVAKSLNVPSSKTPDGIIARTFAVEKPCSFFRAGTVSTPKGANLIEVGRNGTVRMFQNRTTRLNRPVGQKFPIGKGASLAAFLKSLS